MGKIPNTHLILLKSNISQWILVAKGLITELETEGVIKKPDGLVVKIKINLTFVQNPHTSRTINTDVSALNGFTIEQAEVSEGMRRIMEFFTKIIDSSVWILFGHIVGKNNVPILILYYELVNISIYSLKVQNEGENNFFLPSVN